MKKTKEPKKQTHLINIKPQNIITILIITTIILSLITHTRLAQATSLGTIPPTQTTFNSSPGEYIQLKLSYFNSGENDLLLNISYDLLDNGTRYDLIESGKRIYILTSVYPSPSLDDYLTLPAPVNNPTSSTDKEWFAIYNTKKYSEIKSIYLFVTIPEMIVHTNPYKIKLTTTTVSTQSPKKSPNNDKAESIQNIAQQIENIITIYNYPANSPNPPLDSDYDDLTDYEEEKIYHTNPMNKDTDEDGIPDGTEIKMGTDPNIPDITEKAKIIYNPNNPLSNQNEIIGEIADRIKNSVLDSIDNNDKKQHKPNSTTTLTINTKKNISNESITSPTGFLTINPESDINISTLIILIICLLAIYKVLKMDINKI